MPAEWEPHEATWLAWPHNAVRLARPVRAHPLGLRRDRRASSPPARRVRAAGAPTPPTRQGRAGCSAQVGVDLAPRRVPAASPPTAAGRATSGPIFVRATAARREVAHRALPLQRLGQVPRLEDATTASPSGRRATLRRAACARCAQTGRDVVLEGGSIDVNGAGTLLTTEECLLDPAVQVRNPGLRPARLRGACSRDALGATQRHLAGQGHRRRRHPRPRRRPVPLRRPRDRRALPREERRATPTTGPLEENRERLQGARLEDGIAARGGGAAHARARCVFDGQRLPASYANFYIANAAVLVPTFNDPARPRGPRHPGRAVPRPARWSASTPSTWSGASARCTA